MGRFVGFWPPLIRSALASRQQGFGLSGAEDMLGATILMNVVNADRRRHAGISDFATCNTWLLFSIFGTNAHGEAQARRP